MTIYSGPQQKQGASKPYNYMGTPASCSQGSNGTIPAKRRLLYRLLVEAGFICACYTTCRAHSVLATLALALLFSGLLYLVMLLVLLLHSSWLLLMLHGY